MKIIRAITLWMLGISLLLAGEFAFATYVLTSVGAAR